MKKERILNVISDIFLLGSQVKVKLSKAELEDIVIPAEKLAESRGEKEVGIPVSFFTSLDYNRSELKATSEERIGVYCIVKRPKTKTGLTAELFVQSKIYFKDVETDEDLNLEGTYMVIDEQPVSSSTIQNALEKIKDNISTIPILKPLGEVIQIYGPEDFVVRSAKEFILQMSSNVFSTLEEKRKILIAENDLERLKIISKSINRFINEKKLVDDIDNIMKQNLDKQQSEFILREKMRAIRRKLGEEDETEEKNERELFENDEKNRFPLEVRNVIKAETRKLKGMMSSSPEANVTRNYLDLIYSLPWYKVSEEHLDISKAIDSLSKRHFGLKDVKERIIEFLAVLTNKKQKNNLNNKNLIKNLPTENEALDFSLFNKKNDEILNNMPILTLVGPPGTGKTSIVKSIADATGRKMVKISLGGVRDESEIRGHRRTYVGAMPGKIITAIKKSGVSNPIILLDEIDKMSSDFRGDPASAMLEVLDPEQNKFFQDHYLEIEYDLSKVLFIATANYYEAIPEALIDRVEIIELSSYTLLEKKEIAQKHLIPKVLQENQLDENFFNIDSDTIEYIIQKYTREAGVRELKRTFDKIARKIITQTLKNKDFSKTFVIDKKVVNEMLGIEKYSDDINEKLPQIGTVNGLAYTAYGGSTLSIEVNTVASSKAEIKLTGQLKDVMRESAEIALSYVRANAKEFGIDFDFESNQIHIHVPAGAIPKDGPSAGVTFTTAIISALSKKPVSPTIGMTGEITLRGKVLAIGGLKEKSLAAYKFGIKTIFIPEENEKNLVDIADEVKENIKFIPVSNYQQIYDYIFKK
ncbi:endopeptidase La [Mesomycoplasma lagogenitalium]|uniref:Lon protease n=1 Tax=Mesomycoplasma lagogenitalium TaxID=171286 RepID=A0ABY8LXF8_9BACT|nr:endopeptidase La [Mesomycoplasma lagogenitalium]WGI36822.1 endopeptidase La [Mesomycoplasma lagogenitalium]